jgi:membrane protein YqaA with SNARE-associated domain
MTDGTSTLHTDDTSPQERSHPPRRGVAAFVFALHDWARSGWARSAVFTWAFVNGAVIPGPSDALLIPLGLARPTRAYALAWWTTLGAVLGGFVAYAIGAVAFTQLGLPLLHLLGATPTVLDSTRALFATKGWIVVVLGSLPLASPKIVSIAAGAFGVPLWQFALALVGVRLARFMVEATIVRYAGSRILSWVERKLGRSLLSAR